MGAVCFYSSVAVALLHFIKTATKIVKYIQPPNIFYFFLYLQYETHNYITRNPYIVFIGLAFA